MRSRRLVLMPLPVQRPAVTLRPKERKPHCSWNPILVTGPGMDSVYSRKALYKRKFSLQSPRLKRRKSWRSLLLPQNQLVAIKNGENWTVTFCKMSWYYPTKTCHGSYWAMAKRALALTWDGSGQHHSQDHQITLTRCYTGKSGLPEPSGQWLLLLTGPPGLNLEHTRSSLPPPQKSLLISKVKIRKLPTDASFKKKQLCMSGTRKERSSTWRRTS